MGALFESLAALCIRVAASAVGARVFHLRTPSGRQEVDFIIERADGRILAIEAKLSGAVSDRDVRHLRWLSDRIGDQLLDALVVCTGPGAHRRADGIGVVPLALLGHQGQTSPLAF